MEKLASYNTSSRFSRMQRAIAAANVAVFAWGSVVALDRLNEEKPVEVRVPEGEDIDQAPHPSEFQQRKEVQSLPIVPKEVPTYLPAVSGYVQFVELDSHPQKENYALLEQKAAEKGWTGDQWDALQTIVARESEFFHTAENESSDAYGLFQFMPFTWEQYGCNKTDNVEVQIDCGFAYIEERYENPVKALQAHNENGYWY